MRSLIAIAILIFSYGAASADSIHNRSVFLIGIDRGKIDPNGELQIQEVSRFVKNGCSVAKYVRISVQPVSSHSKSSNLAELIRSRLIGETGLSDFQISTIPGGVSQNYLKINDLLDSLPKIKDPMVVEVFC